MSLLTILITTLLVHLVSPTEDPYSSGPYQVDFTTIKPDLFGIELDHHLDVFSPREAGTFPVIVFFPGMSCTVPASYYSSLLTQVASWGYVVLGPWARFYLPAANYNAKWVDPVLSWAKEHLNNPGERLGLGLESDQKLDFSRVILGAQSSGAHVAVEWLKQSESHCDEDLQAVFLLSPVDGMDPFGLMDNFCIEPGTLLNYQTPTLIMSGGLDSMPGIDNMGSLMPACAPQDLANERFFDALPGTSLLVNTTKYGHIDCMDQDMLDIIGGIHFCKTDPDTDKEVYRRFLAGQIVSFLRFVGEGDCEMQDVLLNNLSNPGVEVGRLETKGELEDGCGVHGCLWQEGPF